MDSKTFQAIRSQWDRELRDAQATVTRLTLQIRELDKTWKKLSLGEENAANPANYGGVVRGESLSAKVANAVRTLPEMFASPEVWEALRRVDPDLAGKPDFRANVAGALKKLVDRGELELIEPGQGNRPSRFRRSAPAADDGGASIPA